MLRYLPHKQIDQEAWDACIAASGERVVYGFAWYLNTVCERWDAVVEEVGERYVSVFPLPLGRRFGQTVVQQPYFTQQLGLFTTSESSCAAIAAYLRLIPAQYKKVYLQLNTVNAVSQTPESFGAQERFTYHLSLDRPYTELYPHYSANQKRNLKRALKANLGVQPLQEIAPLVALFRDTRGRELCAMKPKHYALLQKLYLTLQKEQAGELMQVLGPAGDMQAAALLVQQPGQLIFLFGASSEAGKRTGAMAMLLDSCIQQRAGSRCVLDFEGSMVPSVAKFYAGFGATAVPYVSLNRQPIPWYLSWKKASSTS